MTVGKRHRKGSGLRLTDALRGMTQRLPDVIERDILLLPQADQDQPLRRHLALRVIQQDFVGFAFEFFRLQQLAQRTTQGFSIAAASCLLKRLPSQCVRTNTSADSASARPTFTSTCMIFIPLCTPLIIARGTELRTARLDCRSRYTPAYPAPIYTCASAIENEPEDGRPTPTQPEGVDRGCRRPD